MKALVAGALLAGTLLVAASLAMPAEASGKSPRVALEELAEKVTITPAQAVRAAKTVVQGRVKELSLKSVTGQPVYEVEFENDQEVWVDARTGRIRARESHKK